VKVFGLHGHVLSSAQATAIAHALLGPGVNG
jgi:hypothetical protein